MKGYALLVGVNQINRGGANPSRYLPGAKYDLDRLENLLRTNGIAKYESIVKTTYNLSSWNNFKTELGNIKTIVGTTEEVFLFLHFTIHSYVSNNNVNILQFYEQDVPESDFLQELARITPNFRTFVLLNSCFSNGVVLNPTNIQFNCPIGFLTSSDNFRESVSSPNAKSPTYFIKHFVDTWKRFCYLKLNFETFTSLLKLTMRDDLIPELTLYPRVHAFFNQTVPLLCGATYSPFNPAAHKTELLISENSDKFIQVDIIGAHNTYTIIDSLTIDTNNAPNNKYIQGIIENIEAIDPDILDANAALHLDKVRYIGAVLVKIGDTDGVFPHDINYLMSDEVSGNSNGLVVLLNVENNLQVVAHDRTSGRVTNKIGGL